MYGVSLQQRRNDAKIDANLFTNIVTKNKEVGHIHTPLSGCSTQQSSSFPTKLSRTSLSPLSR